MQLESLEGTGSLALIEHRAQTQVSLRDAMRKDEAKDHFQALLAQSTLPVNVPNGIVAR